MNDTPNLDAGCLTRLDFSVIIPWANRDELPRSLSANQWWLQRADVEVLVVNCGGSTELLETILKASPLKHIRHIHVPRSRFNKCLALNVGIFSSRAKTVLILDADIILECDLIRETRSLLSNSFITLKEVRESEPALQPAQIAASRQEHGALMSLSIKRQVVFHWCDGTSTAVTTSRDDALVGSRSGPGILIANKEHLTSIAGYNSDLEFWGWEDNDIQVRLQKVLGLTSLEFGTAVHLTHGNDQRALGGGNPQQTNLTNLLTVCRRYSEGNFSGTYERDIREWFELLKKN